MPGNGSVQCNCSMGQLLYPAKMGEQWKTIRRIGAKRCTFGTTLRWDLMNNIVQSGNSFRFYGDAVNIHNALPPGTYIINFDPMFGFSLEKSASIGVHEKAYGNISERVDKVFRNYESSNRGLGVMASGPKGMGKSMLLRSIAEHGASLGYATVIVDQFYDGLVNFLDSLGEVILVFDEFEKTFDADEQAIMLPMFDGLSMQKRLCVVTLNDDSRISSYAMDRPGRFHYNFTFDYLGENEIRQFLSDRNISESRIDNVVSYARFRDINYDHLRAIAQELSLFDGDFDSLMEDLNIGSALVNLHIEGDIGDIAFNTEVAIDPSKRINSCDIRGKDADGDMFWRGIELDLASTKAVGSSIIVTRCRADGGDWGNDEIRLSKPDYGRLFGGAF